jgi:hypothetical protein
VYSEQDPIPIDTDDQLSDYFSTIYGHQDNTVFIPIMVEEECRLFLQMVRRYEERLAREKEREWRERYWRERYSASQKCVDPHPVVQHKHINVTIPPDLQEALQDAQFEIRMMLFVEELRREFFPDPDGRWAPRFPPSSFQTDCAHKGSSPLDIALRCRLASTFIKSGRQWEGTLSNDIVWLGIIYICESKRLFEKHSLIAIMRRSRGNP